MRNIALTLHAHLPFYPPELDEPNPEAGVPSFGSYWLVENIVDCYLPLLRNLKRLEHVSPNILNVSFSPVLLEQLASVRTRNAVVSALTGLIEKANSDVRRLPAPMKAEARAYHKKLSDLLEFYVSLGKDIVGGFSRLTNVELMTTALTHAFLPLLKYHDAACAFQVAEAARQAREKAGRPVKGFWFPEMGYTPYIGETVSGNFDYFLVAPSAVPAWDGNAYVNRLGARYGVVDLSASSLIWHPVRQFGGLTLARNSVYREFYKWDDSSGLKYWSITGADVALADKSPYSSRAAARQLKKDVPDCLEVLRGLQSDRLLAIDAEFFGHHWYEGSDFLYFLFAQSEESGVQFVPNSKLIMDREADVPEVEPRESCWGSTDVWMGPGTIRDVRMDILAKTENAISLFRMHRRDNDPYRTMLLNRLLRELVLIQASDYAFAIFTGRATRHYDKVMSHHRTSFEALSDEIMKTRSSCERRSFLPTLRRIARVNYLFPDMDYKAVDW